MKNIYLPQVSFDVSEKDLETFLYYRSQEFLGLKAIARQFRTDVGIIDLILKSVYEPNIYFVTELKKDNLDSRAYCQVVRYSTYLNSKMNKENNRVFIPLLVGRNLSDELQQIVYGLDTENIINPHIVRYALFGFDILNGLSFNYRNTKQIYFEKNIYDCSWVDKKDELVGYFENKYEIERVSFDRYVKSA
jgi:hypothetical protein